MERGQRLQVVDVDWARQSIDAEKPADEGAHHFAWQQRLEQVGALEANDPNSQQPSPSEGKDESERSRPQRRAVETEVQGQSTENGAELVGEGATSAPGSLGPVEMAVEAAKLPAGWQKKRRKDTTWSHSSISEREWQETEAQRAVEAKEEAGQMRLDKDAEADAETEWLEPDDEPQRKQQRRASAIKAKKRRKDTATPNEGHRHSQTSPHRIHSPALSAHIKRPV